MKSILRLILLISILLSFGVPLRIKKTDPSSDPQFTPYKNPILKVPLTKITISQNEKEELFTNLLELQKTLTKDRNEQGGFLRLKKRDKLSTYHVKLDKFNSDQVLH